MTTTAAFRLIEPAPKARRKPPFTSMHTEYEAEALTVLALINHERTTRHIDVRESAEGIDDGWHWFSFRCPCGFVSYHGADAR